MTTSVSRRLNISW